MSEVTVLFKRTFINMDDTIYVVRNYTGKIIALIDDKESHLCVSVDGRDTIEAMTVEDYMMITADACNEQNLKGLAK